MTREELYEKSKKEKDVIRRIIKLHVLDTIYGNKRSELDYVDALYPGIETLFGIDVCIEALENKDSLRAAFEEKYSSDIDYDTLKEYFENATKMCERTKKEEKLLKIYNEIITTMEKVYNSSKTKVK